MKLSLNFGIKQLVFYGVILIAVFILSSPFIINRVINTSYIKDRISSFIYKKTGANIDSSKYSLTIFPHASLRIDNFNFMAGDRLIASIDVLKFNIDIKPLLRGKININQITIDHPQINASTLKEKPATLPVDFSLSNYIQELKKVFEFLPEHQESVEITIKNATSQYFRRMDGSLSLSKEKQEIVLNTLIKGIKLKPSEISGTAVDTYLDLNSIELDQIKSIVKISSKGEIQGQCNFIAPKLTSKNNHTLLDSDIIDADFKLSDNFYQVDIAPFELNYPKGKVAIHFETHQTQKQSNIQFIGTQIHIDQAKQMSLRLFKDNEITKTLFNILHKGIVPNISVSFQSKDLKNLFNPHHLTLTGNIEDGSVRIPKTDLIADHVNGKANIHNGILEITANKGLIQTSKIEKGDLTIDLLNYEDIPFHGVFLLDVDLSMIPKTLISLLPDTLLSKELSFVHDVIGHSKARLNLLLETGSDDLKVNVSTDDFGVTGIYDRIPGNISLENVNFKYDPDTVILNHLSGGINGSSVQDLNAKIDLKNKTWINIQSGSGMISLDSMIPWLLSYKKTKQIISPVKDGSGKVYFTSIDLSGPITKPEQWTYDVIGTGLGINARTLLNQKQIENMSCQYHISNDLIDLKKIHVKIKSLTFLEQLIEKKHLDSILVPFDVENGNLHISPNHSFFQTNLKFKSGPELYIDLKGKTLSLSSLQTIKFFDPDSSNGTMSFNHNTKKPLFDFNGRLNTVTLKKIVMPGSFWANKMDDVTEGQPISIHTDKDLVLNIIIKKLNLNSILTQSETFSLGKRFLLPNGIINFKADELKIKKLTITNIDSKVSLKKDHSYIKLNKAFLCDLQTSAYINLKKDIVYANVPFEAKNKNNIQDLLTCLFQKNEFMDGRYSLKGSILSAGPKKDFLNKLSGSLIFNAQQGRIYKLTLLSRILSVLNVSKVFKGNIPDVTQKGFTYQNITIEADIKDSMIYLTKAIIDGTDMTLIFSGWIDPINDKLDLTCLVAPFKTVDLIIEKIPIINTLLDGRLISVPTKATGKLSDPTVTPLHPSAVGEGLIDMMSTILKTPVKLWDKLSGE